VLDRVDAAFANSGLGLLTGPAASPEGRLGSGRWRAEAGAIDVTNVWTSVIEFNLWLRRDIALALGGFDEAMGPGAPLGSAEGNDLVMRAVAAGHQARYDPALRVVHPDKRLSDVAVARARLYGRGLGFALRRHRAPASVWLPFAIRPLGGVAVSLLKGRPRDAAYYAMTLAGRCRRLPDPMRIALGIATRGRAAILGEVLADLARQTRAPDRVLVCHVGPEDVADLPGRFPQVEFLPSPAGLPRQRNAIIDAVPDCGIVLFLDDDFLAAPDYLAVTERVFEARPDCVVTTGTVIADGAKGPGIALEDGRAILEADRFAGDPLGAHPHFNGYGCNMALRLASLRAHGLRFDEQLPLYAWYEDLDLDPPPRRSTAPSFACTARAACISAPSPAASRRRGSATARSPTLSTWRERAATPGATRCAPSAGTSP
jgi:hypothetical protein